MNDLDIIATLARLHEEIDRVRHHLYPMPDLITFASNDVANRLKRYVLTKSPDEEVNTVYVNLKIDAEEESKTKYINLYIDTKRDINAKYLTPEDLSDYSDTKLVHLNINSAPNDTPHPTYHRFRRDRIK
jgi:hypothetical protein